MKGYCQGHSAFDFGSALVRGLHNMPSVNALRRATGKYKVFKFDSRNTGFYVAQDLRLRDARDIATRLSKTNAHKAQVEGNEYFETYEDGVKTEWSAKVKKELA